MSSSQNKGGLSSLVHCDFDAEMFDGVGGGAMKGVLTVLNSTMHRRKAKYRKQRQALRSVLTARMTKKQRRISTSTKRASI